MPEAGDLVLRHLAEACGQVVAHGLNRLSPGSQQAVAAALESGRGDVELHVLGLNPLSLVVDFYDRTSLQRVNLFRVLPNATDDNADRGDDT